MKPQTDGRVTKWPKNIAIRIVLVLGMAPPLLGAQQLGLSVSTGPAIRLDYTSGESPGNPVASFMYFVPLISLEPVSSLTSPGSTQSAPVT